MFQGYVQSLTLLTFTCSICTAPFATYTSKKLRWSCLKMHFVTIWPYTPIFFLHTQSPALAPLSPVTATTSVPPTAPLHLQPIPVPTQVEPHASLSCTPP